MIERALALDKHPVAERLALLDEPFDGALGEVADEAVDRDAPALDHHPGLAGRHERRGVAGRECGAPQLECDGHLADRAVAADRQDDPLARCMTASDSGLETIGRSPVVDDRDPAGCGRSAELRVVADERVESRQHVQTCRDGGEDDRPPCVGSRPPVGAMPINSASGGFEPASASSSVATIGMSFPGR